MKKYILILALLLTMAASITAGTLAMYTTSIDNLAAGSTTAKEFVFVGGGTDTFQQGVKIAPGETVRWQFKVKNYQNSVITETDLYYKLTFNVAAQAGKSAIAPLTVTVLDPQGGRLNGVTGVGAFDVLGAFPLSENGQEREYTVEINWPGDGANDINYAGNNFGTSVYVSAIASQLPFSGGSNPENPPQQHNDISVLYQTTAPWQNGGSGPYQYKYRITITNNGTQPITNWYIAFSLPTDRLNGAYSNAKAVSGLPEGSYRFDNPAYNNHATDDILPGKSVYFEGPAYGRGTEAIAGISVGGSNTGATSNVDLNCGFGTIS